MTPSEPADALFRREITRLLRAWISMFCRLGLYSGSVALQIKVEKKTYSRQRRYGDKVTEIHRETQRDKGSERQRDKETERQRK